MASYTDADAGFSIAYPEHWEVYPYEEEGAIEFAEDDAYFYVSVFAADLLEVTSLEEAAALLLEELEDEFDDVQVRSRDATLLAGLPALAVEYEWYDGFLEALIRAVVIVSYDAGRIVVVDMEAPSADWERYAPIFGTMVTSFVLLP